MSDYMMQNVETTHEQQVSTTDMPNLESLQDVSDEALEAASRPDASGVFFSPTPTASPLVCTAMCTWHFPLGPCGR